MNTPDFNVCFVGHVDHGKSTIVGRLLSDSGTLPDGKIEQIKNYCQSHGKKFEFAFVIDALKEEQRQGITIDSARVFFQSEKRRYQIIDAPGHFQFLKNMISGAARAQAAFLVVDAHSGFTENSRRHASMIHFLGVPSIAVLINKMDLVDYSKEKFQILVAEIKSYLQQWNIHQVRFIPVSGYQGDQLTKKSAQMSWYDGPCLLEYLDSLHHPFEKSPTSCFLVQDTYQFGSPKKIAGVLNTGQLRSGQTLTAWPANIDVTIQSLEGANNEVGNAGDSLALVLDNDLPLRRGDILTTPQSTEFQFVAQATAQMIWLKAEPLPVGKNFLIKCGTQKTMARIQCIEKLVDASTLLTQQKPSIDKGDIAEARIEFTDPIVISTDSSFELNRFVVVDEYQISGGGHWLSL